MLILQIVDICTGRQGGNFCAVRTGLEIMPEIARINLCPGAKHFQKGTKPSVELSKIASSLAYDFETSARGTDDHVVQLNSLMLSNSSSADEPHLSRFESATLNVARGQHRYVSVAWFRYRF